MDIERFVQIHNNPKLLADAKRQSDESPSKDEIRRDVKGGCKTNPDDYHLRVPRSDQIMCSGNINWVTTRVQRTMRDKRDEVWVIE